MHNVPSASAHGIMFKLILWRDGTMQCPCLQESCIHASFIPCYLCCAHLHSSTKLELLHRCHIRLRGVTFPKTLPACCRCVSPKPHERPTARQAHDMIESLLARQPQEGLPLDSILHDAGSSNLDPEEEPQVTHRRRLLRANY